MALSVFQQVSSLLIVTGVKGRITLLFLNKAQQKRNPMAKAPLSDRLFITGLYMMKPDS